MAQKPTYTWENYLQFTQDVPAPTKDLNYLKQIPWLQPYFAIESPYKPIPFFSRLEKDSSLDRFFYKTINTPDTIPHCIALTRKDGAYWEARMAEASAAGTPNAHDKKNSKANECGWDNWDYILLLDLRPDLSGFRDTAHGGVLGALFDEAMGCCTAAYRSAPSERGTSLFTANLNVSYRATVELPSVVAIRVRLEGREGRKWYVRGELVGSDGKVKTDAVALWISMKPRAEENL